MTISRDEGRRSDEGAGGAAAISGAKRMHPHETGRLRGWVPRIDLLPHLRELPESVECVCHRGSSRARCAGRRSAAKPTSTQAFAAGSASNVAGCRSAWSSKRFCAKWIDAAAVGLVDEGRWNLPHDFRKWHSASQGPPIGAGRSPTTGSRTGRLYVDGHRAYIAVTMFTPHSADSTNVTREGLSRADRSTEPVAYEATYDPYAFKLGLATRR